MAAETDTDTTRVPFTIEDREYEYPDFTDLTLDEWELVYDISQVTIQDFAPEENKRLEKARLKKLEHPAVFKAFACVGYMRANPGADPEDAQEIVGRAKMIPFLTSMATGDDDDEEVNPPTGGLPNSGSEPEPSSKKNDDDSSGSSSSSSSKPSGTQEEAEVAATGTIG